MPFSLSMGGKIKIVRRLSPSDWLRYGYISPNKKRHLPAGSRASGPGSGPLSSVPTPSFQVTTSDGIIMLASHKLRPAVFSGNAIGLHDLPGSVIAHTQSTVLCRNAPHLPALSWFLPATFLHPHHEYKTDRYDRYSAGQDFPPPNP